ncbi:hypothetical protein [Flavisolibacter nicotianae]|uniref:hypothetical protein n=1 Tax=Flavisolibacter nicotianae TaxID=2364882 RepID=UPI000EB198EC|nr:hypothetical protein [Flavisolibacter nicotianae]
MKMHTPLLTVLVAATLFTSCKKESTNAENAGTVGYQLRTINRTALVGKTDATGRIAATSINWTAGTASANELKFEAESNSGEVEFKQRAAQQVDLFSATSFLGNITIPAGTYNEVEFKAFLVPSGNSPALELDGTLTAGSVSHPVKFIVASNVELKAEKHNITVAQGEKYSALNSIDLSQLTKGIPESAFTAASLTNNTIVLSATSNTDLYNLVLNNLNSHHGEAEVEHD